MRGRCKIDGAADLVEGIRMETLNSPQEFCTISAAYSSDHSVISIHQSEGCAPIDRSIAHQFARRHDVAHPQPAMDDLQSRNARVIIDGWRLLP